MHTQAGPSINSYSDVIEDTLTDGVHLHVTTGRKLLQTVLAKLHTTCDIQQSEISPAYIAVQKHILPAACMLHMRRSITHKTALSLTTDKIHLRLL